MAILSDFKKQIMLSLIENGVSINKISKITKLGKSTIYYHYKKINGRKNKILNIKPGYTETEGEIVGIFVGDGSQHFERKGYHYYVNIHFGIQNKQYLLYVKNLYETYFKKNFRVSQYKERNMRLITYSKEMWAYFNHYLNYDPKIKHSTVRLKTLNLPAKFKEGFIRGLLDTDGCIYRNKFEKRKRVFFTTTSASLSEQVGQILKNDFNIPCSIYYTQSRRENEKPIFTVNVLSKGIDNFLNIFKPFRGKGL